MSKKYPGHNPNDTFYDDHHKSKGLMTNNEYFTSNAKGGFYEGMEWDEHSQEWVLNEEAKEREYRREEANKCADCGKQKPYCDCY